MRRVIRLSDTVDKRKLSEEKFLDRWILFPKKIRMERESFHIFERNKICSNEVSITPLVPFRRMDNASEGGNHEGKVREECIEDKEDPTRESYSIRLGQAKRRELALSFLEAARRFEIAAMHKAIYLN